MRVGGQRQGGKWETGVTETGRKMGDWGDRDREENGRLGGQRQGGK